MSKSKKSMVQLVNRLRTTANLLEREAKPTDDALRKARADVLREVARRISAWAVEDNP